MGVAQHREEGYGSGGDEVGDEPIQVEVGVAGVERGDLHERGVAPGGIGQLGGAQQLRGGVAGVAVEARPVMGRFQPVE